MLEQQQNDAAYRALLAQGVLAVLLPTEDLRNPCLRALVSDIFADLIVGNFLSGRLCDGTFLYDSVRKAAETVQTKAGTQQWAFDHPESTNMEPKNRLARFGLVSERDTMGKNVMDDAQRTLSYWFWTIAQYVYLTVHFVRMLVKVFSTDLSNDTTLEPTTPVMKLSSPETSFSATKRRPAIIELTIWPTLGNMLDMYSHMPWLAGCIALAQHFLLYGPGKVGGTDSRLDR